MTAYRALGWFSALLVSVLLLAGVEMMAQAESALPTPTHRQPTTRQSQPPLAPVVLPTIEVRPDAEDLHNA